MERLKRFDIARYGTVLMVVVESELLPQDPAVVVIPLLSDYPVVRSLNPTIQVGDRQLVLATRLIGAVRRSSLHCVGSAADQRDEITKAIDILMEGV